MLNRIRSNAGATILIALLFFLMCAVAGSIILAAGTSASGRVSGLIEQEQSYYSVTSAAQLIKGEIENQEFDYYYKASDESKTPIAITNPDSDIAKVLINGGKTILSGSSDTTYTENLTFTPDSSLGDGIDTVRGVFKMNSDYSITVELYSLDGDKQAKNSYICTVEVPAALSKNKVETGIYNDGDPYTMVETDLLWTGGKIQKTE